ncbi:hypothetical protein [Bacillus sp. AFS041924]|uniref:hypothetical protein n=1 Tax=Bacillus sp. AFS041924 TaxID=2033503 RepID=UPI000BFC9257|nr:hypothetical protein [Bacillus sp. AFS041924]PGS56552.1 hypothetical protein COC46_00365 [Bacillus sp. AFS041924]
MSEEKGFNLFKIALSAIVCSLLVFGLILTGIKVNVKADSNEKYNYNRVLSSFDDQGAQGLVKQYIQFLQDPTYNPGIANKSTYMPNLKNAATFVNSDFNIKPSIFASLRSVNTSVLDKTRNFLWVGTDKGVTMTNLKSKKIKSYTKADGSLLDDKVLLLINDGHEGVYAITETGVSHLIHK